jgi:hypothetical protein
MKKFIFIVSLLILITPLFAGNPVSVPIRHEIYRFLDRMETLGILDNILDGVKPFDREHIAELLVEINLQRENLTRIDRDRLDNYLLDFRFEVDYTRKYAQIEGDKTWYTPFSSWARIKKDFFRLFAQNQPEENNYLFLWEDSTNSFYLEFIYDFTYDHRNDDVSRNKDVMTFSFRGTIYNNFGYMAEVSFANIRGDEEYRNSDPLLKGTWINNREGVTYFDRSGGDVAYRSPYVDFHFAMQPITWGVGESDVLILSDNVEQYPYFSISKYWSWGNFTYLHGKLLADSIGVTEQGQSILPDKWVVSNRFEFSPFTGMAVGLTGVIIYGNRSADWAYLFPLNFLRATEHNLRDRDNALLAIDLESRVFRGTKIYGTFLIDEWRKEKIGTDWFGNKHGFQLGIHLTDLFSVPNIALRFEYLAIMPWVYTHRFDINRYINNSSSLGYWAGPNSEIFYIHLEKEWHWRLITGLKWRQWNHGHNYRNKNIGGDILQGHSTLLGDQEEPVQTTKFLEGIPENDIKVEFYTRYEVFNDFYLNFKVINTRYSNPEESTNLTELHFGLRIDY